MVIEFIGEINYIIICIYFFFSNIVMGYSIREMLLFFMEKFMSNIMKKLIYDK